MLNPSGRPKYKWFQRKVKRELLADDGCGEKQITHVVRNMIDAAAGQDSDRVRAAEFLRDTLDGRPSPDSDAASGPSINVNVMTMQASSAADASDQDT